MSCVSDGVVKWVDFLERQKRVVVVCLFLVQNPVVWVLRTMAFCDGRFFGTAVYAIFNIIYSEFTRECVPHARLVHSQRLCIGVECCILYRNIRVCITVVLSTMLLPPLSAFADAAVRAARSRHSQHARRARARIIAVRFAKRRIIIMRQIGRRRPPPCHTTPNNVHTVTRVGRDACSMPQGGVCAAVGLYIFVWSIASNHPVRLSCERRLAEITSKSSV